MEAAIADAARCLQLTNVNVPTRPSPANCQRLVAAIETGLAALRIRLIPPPPPRSSLAPISIPIAAEEEAKPTDEKDPFDFLATEPAAAAIAAVPPLPPLLQAKDAKKEEPRQEEEVVRSDPPHPAVVVEEEMKIADLPEQPKPEVADEKNMDAEKKQEEVEPTIEDKWSGDDKEKEKEEAEVPEAADEKEEEEEEEEEQTEETKDEDGEAEEQQPQNAHEIKQKGGKKKAKSAGNKFVDDECEESSDADEEGDEDEEDEEEDEEMKSFIVPDSEAVVELLDDDEDTFEEIKEKKKKKKAKEEDPAALEAKAKEEEKIRQALGPFFSSLGGRTAGKQKEIIDVVVSQNVREKKIHGRLHPTGGGKTDAQATPGEKRQQQQRRNLSICREITNDLFFDWGTVAATCVGFRECYGGDVQAEAPLKKYHSGAGHSLSLLYRRIREARSEDCVERDLAAICEGVARFGVSEIEPDEASKSASGAGGGKKRARQTLSDMQELIRCAGKATLLECFCAPDNCPDDAFVQTACRGYMCKPRQAVMVKMETPADGYKVDKAVVLVPKAIAVLLEAVHSLLQVEAFITRSPDVIAWAAKNRDAFKDEAKTPNEIRADLAQVFESLWREWATLRKNFCAQF